jgi:hypothetical protein
VARVCRRFPVILDLLSSGAVGLSAVRLLSPHLTAENHREVLDRATGKRLQDVQVLVAELAPRPDVPASIRKLPSAAPASPTPQQTPLIDDPFLARTGLRNVPDGGGSAGETIDTGAEIAAPSDAQRAAAVQESGPGPSRLPDPRTSRPVLQPLSPERYRVQFTIGQATRDAVTRLQALMRRELPDGDLAVIFDQGVRLLLEKVEKAKFGVGARRRTETLKAGGAHPYETRIRFKTDPDGIDPRRDDAGPRSETGPAILRRDTPSRHVPSAVKREVWGRDGGQCAFVSAGGRRCTERAYLELHHVHPHALDGPATVGNISLRCRRHNAYEAELVFGPDGATVRESVESRRT